LEEWQLSHTQAGWISVAYYAGYMVLVPVLASITDRIDARKVMCIGAILGILAAIGSGLQYPNTTRRRLYMEPYSDCLSHQSDRIACQHRWQRPLSIIPVDNWHTLCLNIPYGIL